MSASLPNFEYDIFISYRHKDNKSDHWVTEFVSALKTELEATSSLRKPADGQFRDATELVPFLIRQRHIAKRCHRTVGTCVI